MDGRRGHIPRRLLVVGLRGGSRIAVRRLGLLLAGVAAVTAAAHTAWWWATGSALIATLQRPGPAGATLHHAGIARGGWPWRARVDIAAPVLRHPLAEPAPAGTLAARTATAEVALAAPRTARIALACPCRLALPDLPQVAPVTVTAERLVLTVALDREGAWRLDGTRLVLAQGAVLAELAALEAHGGPDAAPGYTLAVSLAGLVLGAGAGPFGREVRRAAGELVLVGDLPAVEAGALAAWRDGGGRLELRRLALAWGPLALSAAATLGLDGELQPMGAGTLRLAEWRAALEAATAAGLIEPRAAALLRFGLAAATRPAPGGGTMAEVPLRLRDRTLSVGPVPLARLPVVHWPNSAR